MFCSAHAIIILLLLVIIFMLYNREKLTSRPTYIGHPLIDSINDSGADLRELGTEFTSADQDLSGQS
jgi:hypothetical protein